MYPDWVFLNKPVHFLNYINKSKIRKFSLVVKQTNLKFLDRHNDIISKIVDGEWQISYTSLQYIYVHLTVKFSFGIWVCKI